MPPVRATSIRSQRGERHSSARPAPARRYREPPVSGAPISGPRKGRHAPVRGCHQSEPAPPVLRAKPATLAIVVSGGSRTTCRVNAPACAGRWIPSHTRMDPVAQNMVLPIARSGAVSPRASCSPSAMRVRGWPSVRTPLARIASPCRGHTVPRSPSADPHSTTTRRSLTRDREEAPLGERHLLGVPCDPTSGEVIPSTCRSIRPGAAWW
jgi:hypothetical protein